jgi:hypothetical protein
MCSFERAQKNSAQKMSKLKKDIFEKNVRGTFSHFDDFEKKIKKLLKWAPIRI